MNFLALFIILNSNLYIYMNASHLSNNTQDTSMIVQTEDLKRLFYASMFQSKINKNFVKNTNISQAIGIPLQFINS